MEREAQFSPDGQYMAYSSSESGQREVYVEPIPRDGHRWQMSTDYGREPRWRGDGRELFYLGREERLMAVPVRAHGRGLEVDKPVAAVHTPGSRIGRPLPLRRGRSTGSGFW